MSNWRQMLGIESSGTEPTEGTQPLLTRSSVGCVGSVPERANSTSGVRNVPAVNDTSGRDPIRWHRFVATAVALGVTDEELSGRFPHEEDREDIRLTPDADIEPCARTIADAVLRCRAPSGGRLRGSMTAIPPAWVPDKT